MLTTNTIYLFCLLSPTLGINIPDQIGHIGLTPNWNSWSSFPLTQPTALCPLLVSFPKQSNDFPLNFVLWILIRYMLCLASNLDKKFFIPENTGTRCKKGRNEERYGKERQRMKMKKGCDQSSAKQSEIAGTQSCNFSKHSRAPPGFCFSFRGRRRKGTARKSVYKRTFQPLKTVLLIAVGYVG
jgi:hypothetical protein